MKAKEEALDWIDMQKIIKEFLELDNNRSNLDNFFKKHVLGYKIKSNETVFT